MKKREKKVVKIIQNPDLVAAMKGWQPIFGNNDDYYIVKRLESLNHKLTQVDNDILRGVTKGAGKTPITSKMREILQMEKHLIEHITQRKMDF